MPHPARRTLRLLLACLPSIVVAVVYGVWPPGLTAQGLRLQDTLGVKDAGGAGDKPVEFAVQVLPPLPAPGSEFTLSVTATIPPRHYIYSTKPKKGSETQLTVTPSAGITPVDPDFQPDRPPIVYEEPGFDGALQTSEKHVGKVTWTRRYRVAESTAMSGASVAGQIAYQVCNDSTCRKPKPYEFEIKLGGEAASSAPLATQPAAPLDAAAPERGAPSFVHTWTSKGKTTVLSTWYVTVQPATARPGDVVTLSIATELAPTWHIYAIDQAQTADGGGPFPTAISVEGLEKLVPVDTGFQPDVAPHEEPSEGWPELTERFFEKQVVWTQRFTIPANVPQQSHPFDVAVEFQVCRTGTCMKGHFETQGQVNVAAVANAAPNVLPAPAKGADAGPALIAKQLVKPAGKKGLDKSGGLMAFLIAAGGAGFLALLTPCVFPMIPITVSFFMKQAEKKHHRPVRMAGTYCLGIIGTFTGLGLLLSILFSPTFLNEMANNGWMNVAIGGILVFFGFNLLGMFEIRMPSWLLTYTAGQEGRGGYWGVLFMALTFTLTSFTCTFAFAGGLLVAATAGDRLWPILGLLTFSAAFSLPFFFLAMFPSLLNKLPKSGGWMNLVKVTMGMIELGAAFKFFSNADWAWHPTPWIFDYEFVLAAWLTISVTTGLYLLGVFRLPHDTPRDHIGVFRVVTAMSFLGLAVYLGTGLLSKERPSGGLWANIDATLPPRIKGGMDSAGYYVEHGGLRYSLDIQKALAVAVREKRPLFLDFTGVNCANCRKMEHGPMSQPENKERLARFVRIQIFTDIIPRIDDAAEARRLLEMNREVQKDWFGDVSLPAYAVVPPDPDLFSDPNKILSKLIGADEDGFSEFLDEGWDRWSELKTASGGVATASR